MASKHSRAPPAKPVPTAFSPPISLRRIRYYRRILAAHHLDTSFLGAPTSTDERLAKIAPSFGFLYLISRTG